MKLCAAPHDRPARFQGGDAPVEPVTVGLELLLLLRAHDRQPGRPDVARQPVPGADGERREDPDLFAATAEPETQQLAARYSNDGLHLTTAGYRLVAERLYQEVFCPGPHYS